MAFEEDIRKEETKEVDIRGRKFALKYLRGVEMDGISNKIYKVNQATNSIEIDVALKNKELLRHAVVDAPYEINKKPWKELTPQEREDVLDRLDPTLRTQILAEITKMNEADPELLKKSMGSSGAE